MTRICLPPTFGSVLSHPWVIAAADRTLGTKAARHRVFSCAARVSDKYGTFGVCAFCFRVHRAKSLAAQGLWRFQRSCVVCDQFQQGAGMPRCTSPAKPALCKLRKLRTLADQAQGCNLNNLFFRVVGGCADILRFPHHNVGASHPAFMRAKPQKPTMRVGAALCSTKLQVVGSASTILDGEQPFVDAFHAANQTNNPVRQICSGSAATGTHDGRISLASVQQSGCISTAHACKSIALSRQKSGTSTAARPRFFVTSLGRCSNLNRRFKGLCTRSGHDSHSHELSRYQFAASNADTIDRSVPH